VADQALDIQGFEVLLQKVFNAEVATQHGQRSQSALRAKRQQACTLVTSAFLISLSASTTDDSELRQRLKELAQSGKSATAHASAPIGQEGRSGSETIREPSGSIGRAAYPAKEGTKEAAFDAKGAVTTTAAPNEQWAIDFIHDMTGHVTPLQVSHRARPLYPENAGHTVDTSISGKAVIDTSSGLLELRSKPQTIVLDNGPEFTSTCSIPGQKSKGKHLAYIRTRKAYG